MITLAVDCMGGDHGPRVTLEACEKFLATHADAQLLLVGKSEVLAPWVSRPRVTVIEASEVVAMDDPIEIALRKKKDSSMRVAIQQVKDGKADVAVSAGNTGALMAIARYLLKTIEGIDRPAIASQMPQEKGGATTVLDLGANVDCQPEHLLQFAVMGAALVSALQPGGPEPSVGLLNIGEEAIKGNETIKRTGELLRSAGQAGALNFYGNVEGNDIYKGTVDIVVCDGFVGNVALKLSEGLAGSLSRILKRELLGSTLAAKLGTFLAKGAFRRFARFVDYAEYGGAPLLGLQGIVIVCHGKSNIKAITSATTMAALFVEKRTNERLVANILANEELARFGKATK